MNRKIVGFLALFFTVCLIGLHLYISGTSNRLDNFYISDAKWDQIKSEREEDMDFNIDDLQINHVRPAKTNSQVFYSIIEGDKHKFNPEISVTTNYSFAARGDKMSDYSLEYNHPVEFIVYDNKSYKVFNLISTTLPVLSLDFDGEKYPDSSKNINFKMSLYDNREKVINRVTNSDGSAHVRGASSRWFEKNNLKLKLTYESIGENTRSNPQELLGMSMDDEWTLDGMFKDYEMARNRLSLQIWNDACAKRNDFGLNLSYNSRYVEVVANGEYMGLYLLGNQPKVEKIDPNQDPEHPDIMFKAGGPEDYEKILTGEIKQPSYQELKTDTDKQTAWAALKDYWRAIRGDDTDTALRYVDTDNNLMVSAFLNAVQDVDLYHGDGTYKNVYLLFKWDGENYKTILIPWDFDIGLGSDTLGNQEYFYAPDLPISIVSDLFSVFKRTEQTDLIWNQYYANYQALQFSAWKEDTINNYLDNIENEVFNSGAFRRDAARWPNANREDPDLKLSRMREFLMQRFEFMNQYYTFGKILEKPVYDVSGNILIPADEDLNGELSGDTDDANALDTPNAGANIINNGLNVGNQTPAAAESTANAAVVNSALREPTPSFSGN